MHRRLPVAENKVAGAVLTSLLPVGQFPLRQIAMGYWPIRVSADFQAGLILQ
jgi:hypothetical protein